MSNREVRGPMKEKKDNIKNFMICLRNPEINSFKEPARPATPEERKSFNASDVLWMGDVYAIIWTYSCALIDLKDGWFGFWVVVDDNNVISNSIIYISDNLINVIERMPSQVYDRYVKETHPLPSPEGKSAHVRK